MGTRTSAELYRLVGERIASARNARGWSQTRLSQKARISRGSVANIETGRQKAPLSTIWRLAQALEVEASSLIPTRRDLGATDSSALQDLPKKARRIVESTRPSTRRAVDALMSKIQTDEATDA